MRTVLVIDTATGEDAELDHEDIQTIRDVLTREQARAIKTLDQFPPLYPRQEGETIDEQVGREKVLTWHRMLSRILDRLG